MSEWTKLSRLGPSRARCNTEHTWPCLFVVDVDVGPVLQQRFNYWLNCSVEVSHCQDQSCFALNKHEWNQLHCKVDIAEAALPEYGQAEGIAEKVNVKLCLLAYTSESQCCSHTGHMSYPAHTLCQQTGDTALHPMQKVM